jgi:hypothetical protein
MSGGGLARLGGICGLLFVLLIVPAYVVGYPDAPTSTSSAREVLGYFGTSAGTFVLFNGTVALLSTFFFLWFLGVLHGVLRRAEGVDGVLSTVALAGGMVFITLSCAGYTAEILHPATLERFVNFVPDGQRTFESLALSAWLYHFCQVGDAVMISAASLVVLGDPGAAPLPVSARRRRLRARVGDPRLHVDARRFRAKLSGPQTPHATPIDMLAADARLRSVDPAKRGNKR